MARTFFLLGLVVVGFMSPGRGHADPLHELMHILGSAKDYKQRLAAAIGLARYKDRRSVPKLIKALKDPHHTVRGTVARVLGTIGDQRARPALEAMLLRAKDNFVRGQAQKALAALMARAEKKKPAGRGTRSRMQVLGTLGTLDQHSIQEGINVKLQRATGCFARQLDSAPYLGGKIELKFRVATDGKVRWVRVKQSDLGSLEVEQCIIEEMMQASFDRPDGGEAEFSIPLTFRGGDAVTTLDPESSMVVRRLRRSCRKLLRAGRRARLSAPTDLQVGLYVDTRGKVVSAGLSAGGAEIPTEFAKAFVANLKQLELRDPSIEESYGKLVYRPSCR